MALARRLSSLGRAARAEAGMKVRQPLARALVYLPPGSPTPPPGVVEDELNVDRGGGHRRAGRRARLRAGAQLQAARPPARHAGPGTCGRPWARSTAPPPPPTWPPAGRWWSSWPTAPSSSSGDEVELRVRAQPGFAVSRDGAEVVALDLALDDDLRRRGLAREVIRNVQDLRKAAGLEVSDWIHLHLVGLDDLEPLFEVIAREVLARSIGRPRPRGRRRRAPSSSSTTARAARRVDGLGGQGVSPTGRAAEPSYVLAVDLGTGGPKVAVVSDGGPDRGPRHRAGGPAPAGRAAGPSRIPTSGGRPSAPAARRALAEAGVRPGRADRGGLHGPVVGHGGGRTPTARR